MCDEDDRYESLCLLYYNNRNEDFDLNIYKPLEGSYSSQKAGSASRHC